MRSMNPGNFKGYRSHPVYMEKVSNYLLDIQTKENESKEQLDAENEEEFEDSEQQQPFQPAQQQQPYQQFSPYTQGAVYPTMTPANTSKYQTQPPQNAPASAQPSTTKRTVKSSDLRAKRNKIVNNTYQTAPPVAQSITQKAPTPQQLYGQQPQPAAPQYGAYGKKGAAYRVALSIDSGAFQSDSF